MKDRHHSPPRVAAFVLGWLLSDDWETPVGDFEEVYNEMVRIDGMRSARRWYRRQVAALFPGRVIEKTLWSMILLFNNLKIAFRTLRKQMWFATINIGGLAIGIAAFILIMLFVQDELSYDSQHAKSDRIVRVVEARTTPEGGSQHYGFTMGALGSAMVSEIPGVENYVMMLSSSYVGRQAVQFGDNRFYEDGYLYADDSFFEVFDYPWLSGSHVGALSGQHQAILTQSAARKYFGDVDPMGKVFNVERDGDFTVVGLIKDPPLNSHLDFSMLLSLDTRRAQPGWKESLESWESDGVITYLLLEDSNNSEAVLTGMKDLLVSHVPADELALRTLSLQSLRDIHFGSSHIDFEANRGRSERSTVYTIGMIALFILLIACINYTNMATASSMQRAKEVGLRKSVGASKRQLARQFMVESMVVTSGALLLALGIAWLSLPLFNEITGKSLELAPAGNPALLGTLAILLFAVGIISGSYPAFLLVRFDPATVLKGNFSGTASAGRIRQALVVAQFTVSIGLILASLIVSNQLDFLGEKRLGFNEDQLVIIDINDGNSRASFQSIKDDLIADPSVLSVSVSSRIPGDWKSINQVEVNAPDNGSDAGITANFIGIDDDFLETYEISLVGGRNLSEASTADSLSVLLNQAGADVLGAGIGSHIQIPGASLMSRYSETTYDVEVVGIVEDFNFKSLRETVGPIVLGFRSNPIVSIDYFTVRLDGQNLSRSMDHLRAIGEKYDPRHPFESNFLDDRLADFYQAETRLGNIFNVATILAILIACLGVFGLAAYSVGQRTKEIGVRKVVGASVSSILVLLSQDILALILISYVLATPITYLLMTQWLKGFAYQAELGAGLFLFALGVSVALAMLAVCYQSIRAALSDPIDSLRYE